MLPNGRLVTRTIRGDDLDVIRAVSLFALVVRQSLICSRGRLVPPTGMTRRRRLTRGESSSHFVVGRATNDSDEARFRQRFPRSLTLDPGFTTGIS